MKPGVLVVLLAAVFYGYDYFPRRHATAMALLGLLVAVLLWSMRGPRHKIMWPICIFGVIEGIEVFVCQLAWNWWPVDVPRFHGIGDVYTGLQLYGWGLSALSFIAYLLAREPRNG